MADLHMESQLEALPPAEVEDPADSSLQAMLLAQMRQNALLLERLVNKSGDGIQDALAGGASASDGSEGIKGHLARDAYVRQLSDLKTVATKVEANALTKLGMTTSEPGLMRSYLEKRVPLGDLKTLQYLRTMAAYGWETGYRSANRELQGFASRLLMFVEQSALDQGKLQLAYLMGGYPDPSPQGFAAREAPGLKSVSRLAQPQWLAANLAYLKDLDYAESRIAQLGTNRNRTLHQAETAEAETEEGEKPQRPRRPRRPKNPPAST